MLKIPFGLCGTARDGPGPAREGTGVVLERVSWSGEGDSMAAGVREGISVPRERNCTPSRKEWVK